MCPSSWLLLSSYAVLQSLRAGIAGLLVGAGASLGGGCTSGHGICGIARLSPRSFIYTALILFSGSASAWLFSTSTQLNSVDVNSQDGAQTVLGLCLLISASVTLAMSAFSLNRGTQHSPMMCFLSHITNFTEGILFSLALGIAGMTRPSKVVGFLTLKDFSAAFVMGGAILVSLPVFLPIYRQSKSAWGKAVIGKHYPQPPTDINAKLVLGGVVFGLGWGAGGYCPGPVLANISQEASQQAMICLATMLTSLFAFSVFDSK